MRTVSRFFPFGNLRSLSIPALPGTFFKISEGKFEKNGKNCAKNGKRGKIKNKTLF